MGGGGAYLVEINEVGDCNGDGAMNLDDVAYLLRNDRNTSRYLEGSGDFRSAECKELLRQADVVVTNPPFSLFREYVSQLVAFDKRFLIVGNQNAITYKEIFKLIQGNKLWLGYTKNRWFGIPPHYPLTSKNYRVENGRRFIAAKDACWFTNLVVDRRLDPIIPYQTYAEGCARGMYPRYDNYDAIEVSRVADIPSDYMGVMGVPISFLDKYSPDQFDIVGMAEDNGKGYSGGLWDGKNPRCVVCGATKFKRIFIRHRKGISPLA